MTWYESTILVISAVSALAALIATCITWGDFRRSNSVVLTLEKCVASCCQAVDENNGRPYAQLTLLVRNKGIPLHSMTAQIVFTGVPQLGAWRIWLRQLPAAREQDVFAKGMLADVTLKSYVVGDVNCSCLLHLKNPRKQRARLLIYSQGYLAAQFPLGGLFDPPMLKWNSLASRFNRMFDRHVRIPDGMGPDGKGTPAVNPGKILPLFATRAFEIDSLVRGIAAVHRLAAAPRIVFPK